MAALVCGMLVVHYTLCLLQKGLSKTPVKPAFQSTVVLSVSILLYTIVMAVASVLIGFKSENIFKFLMVLTLAAVAVTLMFRPYLPSLPFHVGNTIKSGSLLGRVRKPKGFKVHLQRMNQDDPQTDFMPGIWICDSDAVALRSAWKRYQATQSDEPDFGNGQLANIYVVDEEGRPVNHYATAKLDVYNPKLR